MTPFEVLQWIGVAFMGIVALAIGIVAIKAAIQHTPTPPSDQDPDIIIDKKRNDL